MMYKSGIKGETPSTATAAVVPPPVPLVKAESVIKASQVKQEKDAEPTKLHESKKGEVTSTPTKKPAEKAEKKSGQKVGKKKDEKK